jgi:hypothetical protein
MKLLLILLLTTLLIACGPESSPEGRMTIKMEDIRKEFDTLKHQNERILDSLGSMNERLQKLEHKK